MSDSNSEWRRMAEVRARCHQGTWRDQPRPAASKPSSDWARRWVENLEAVLADVELAGRAARAISRLVGNIHVSQILERVWERLQEHFRGRGVMVAPWFREVDGFSVATLDAAADRRIADWILDLIGPDLDEVFTRKRRR